MASDFAHVSNGLTQLPGEIALGAVEIKPNVEALDVLRKGFGTEFSLVDGDTGELVHSPDDWPAADCGTLAELCRSVSRAGRAEFVGDEDPLLMLALPLPEKDGKSYVALGAFLSRPLGLEEDVSGSARALGMNTGQTKTWARRQIPWNISRLTQVSKLVLENIAIARRLEKAVAETESLSVNLAATYEEISLLYRLTQNLKISQHDDELGRVALEWIEEVLPAQGFAIQYVPVEGEDESVSHRARTASELITSGLCPVDDDRFTRLIAHLDLDSSSSPSVVNLPITAEPTWPEADVRQLIVVPLTEGENLFGWLAAFNHVDDDEFGTVEASLLSSVAAILGIHSGNIDLYRQQAELLAGVVRALTSAIDAKDPYTCGHSDRVARISVCLAEELGYDEETLKTIYLSGLLHDIGKIGVNDSVLCKPGKLTDFEYEHIKTHVEIGYKILADLKKLDNVLPVVLHHHESWDGRGYPNRLPAEEIPLSARIVAVADSFDAMGSDRPYRKAMPDEKIDDIFRSGSGKQWDPVVVDAFFKTRDDIRRICREGEEQGD